MMKSSRRSDREPAKVIDVSQSILSGLIKKFEYQGVIKESLGFNSSH